MNRRMFVVVLVAVLVGGAAGALLGVGGQQTPDDPNSAGATPASTTAGTATTTGGTATTTLDDGINRSEYHPEDPGTRNLTIRNYRFVPSDNETWNATVNTSRIESLVFQKINEVRAEHDLHQWQPSYRLGSNVRAHSQWMVENRNISHVNGDGQHSWERWAEMEPSICVNDFGENLVVVQLRGYHSNANPYMNSNQSIANESIKLWKNSQSHRELMLSDENYEYMGVGATVRQYNNSQAWVFIGMNVCGPKSQDPDAPFENSTSE